MPVGSWWSTPLLLVRLIFEDIFVFLAEVETRSGQVACPIPFLMLSPMHGTIFDYPFTS